MMDRGQPTERPPALAGNRRGPRRGVRCYNCGEDGHIAPECPEPPRERGGMYPLLGRGRGRGEPMAPPQEARAEPHQPAPAVPTLNEEGRRINVITLEEDAEVLANKRLRSGKLKETEEVKVHRSKKGKTMEGEQRETSKA